MAEEIVETQWRAVGVGSIIIDKEGGRWLVTASALPAQFDYGMSCWFKIAPEGGGPEIPIEPRFLGSKITLAVDPARPVEPAWPEGAREMALLQQALGAQEIGTQDTRTGEIWCPMHIWGVEEELLHLRVAHGMDTTGIVTPEQVATIHGRAHNPKYPDLGKSGFTHRHMPEDMPITGA